MKVRAAAGLRVERQRAFRVSFTIMSDKLPRDYGMWLRTLGGILLAFVVVALLFPVIAIETDRGERKTEVKTAVIALNMAIKAYYTEYGHWPDFTSDGLFLDEQRQGQLLRVLCAKDEVNNPRKILFFEAKTATESSGKYRNGIRPETGVFYDPWSQPYRIALDVRDIGTIANPYPDDGPIHASVIVWSLGKDGQQGAPANPRTHNGSDDVTSWQ